MRQTLAARTLNAATRLAASYAVARRTTLGILLRDAAVSTPTLHFSISPPFLFFYTFVSIGKMALTSLFFMRMYRMDYFQKFKINSILLP